MGRSRTKYCKGCDKILNFLDDSLPESNTFVFIAVNAKLSLLDWTNGVYLVIILSLLIGLCFPKTGRIARCPDSTPE